MRKETGNPIELLPDGLDNLRHYNLLSYKSLREPFDDWALKELTGHYVNYRKQISPSFQNLLPEEEFQLFGVSSRYPQKLASQVEFQAIQEGVYEIQRGSDLIRMIVLSEIAHAEHNAIWHLFSGIPGEVEFASRQYRGHTREISTILNQLFENYHLEGLEMTYTMEDFQKEYVRDHLGVLSTDEILKRLSTDEILKRFSLEEIQNYLEKEQKQSRAIAPQKNEKD